MYNDWRMKRQKGNVSFDVSSKIVASSALNPLNSLVNKQAKEEEKSSSSESEDLDDLQYMLNLHGEDSLEESKESKAEVAILQK